MLVQISLQNLVKTLCIFHKMIRKFKKIFACAGPIFVNQFCFTNSNTATVFELLLQPYCPVNHFHLPLLSE